ncbi:unnamed protein product [Lymnaea stagnalis]|uniref:MRH domain-containing protein n=1 Tax=Lymnaea stagnalis TaxID=6523 RepID=A0AAV2HBW9_LYMST
MASGTTKIETANAIFFKLGLLISYLCIISVTIFTGCSEGTIAAEERIGECVFPSYPDKKALNEEKMKLGSLIGKTFTAQVTNQNESYHFTIGICADVKGGQGVAVWQQPMKDGKIVEKDGTLNHIIGSLKDTHIMTGTDWVLLEYKGGEVYGSHCGSEPRRTSIMITCDPDVELNNAEMIFLEEENTKSDLCFYLFELKHKAVCPNPSGGGGLSIGSILVIVFFTVLGVYLFLGFLYQRFVLKSKGLEQIPNYEFWKDFGNLQADGCDLMCRTREHRRMHGMGGLGDDQLEPSDEIRDDNLLPM